MIAVIFEVQPKADQYDEYLNIAASLKASLQAMDGFISIERFQSLNDNGKILSLSFWRDEAAVKQWRTQSNHRAAQATGRQQVFDDYRIRIAPVTRDYSMHHRDQTPQDSLNYHKTTPTIFT